MIKRIWFGLVLGSVLCCMGCSMIESESQQENDTAIILSWDDTEEDVSVKEADFTEKDLHAIFEAVNNEEIVDFIYDDYNRDGIHEAFVLTKKEELYNLWYVHSKECQIICENLEDIDEPATDVLGFNTKAYLLIQQKKDDVRNTIVYSIDNNDQVRESGISKKGYLTKAVDGEILLQIDQKLATADSFVVETKTYYLYYVFDEGFREYGAIPIGMEQFLEFEGAQEIIDSISEKYSDYEIEYSFLYRANHYMNVNIALSKDGNTEYKNMTLAYDEFGVKKISETLSDGKMETAYMLSAATFPMAFKHPKTENNQ